MKSKLLKLICALSTVFALSFGIPVYAERITFTVNDMVHIPEKDTLRFGVEVPNSNIAYRFKYNPNCDQPALHLTRNVTVKGGGIILKVYLTRHNKAIKEVAKWAGTLAEFKTLLGKNHHLFIRYDTTAKKVQHLCI